MVNRTKKFRAYSGTIDAGEVSIGDDIKILPSKETATVTDIFSDHTHFNTAVKSQALSIVLNKDLDISRGDIIISKNCDPEISSQFKALLIWLDKNPGFQSRKYLLKLGPTIVNAQITKIDYSININNYFLSKTIF
jgi:bifunctional enzyme CysN/CysC